MHPPVIKHDSGNFPMNGVFNKIESPINGPFSIANVWLQEGKHIDHICIQTVLCDMMTCKINVISVMDFNSHYFILDVVNSLYFVPWTQHISTRGRKRWSGWWFGTWILFFHILGIIIPSDELIFVQRGLVNHQPDS